MRIKTFFKRNKSIILGLIIGGFLGVLQNPIILVLEDTNFFLLHLIDKEFDYICNLFNKGIGEPCGWFMLFWGFIIFPLVYGIIGGLIGFIVRIFKRWK